MYKVILCLVWVCFEGKVFSAEEKQSAENYIAQRILVLNPNAPPTLEYICLKKRAEENASLELIPTVYQIGRVAELNWETDDSLSNIHYDLSTINNSLLSEWLLGEYFDQIEIQWRNQPFLFNKSELFAAFLEKKHQEKLEEIAAINERFKDKNFSYSSSNSISKDPNLRKKKPFAEETEKGITKYALYLLIGGGICAAYSVLAPSVATGGNPSRSKVILARRKRWLEKVFKKGWIDRPTYHFLLKKIESLPEWLGGVKQKNQSENTDYSSDISVDLSKRKSGESVVKTKDTSLDKTSR